MHGAIPKSPIVAMTPAHLDAGGHPWRQLGITSPSAYASTAWPTTDMAMFFPFVLFGATLLRVFWWHNGATVSGNVDVGVYDVDGTRIISTGSTAQAGTSTTQEVNVTDTIIGPGDFYLAMACDNTTATFLRGTASIPTIGSVGCAQQASAFALPATATFARYAQAYIPLFGFYTRVV